MKIFNHMRNHPMSAFLLALMVVVAIANGLNMVYGQLRADMREDMTASLQTAPDRDQDIITACLTWVKRQGMDDAACQPFADTEWAVMNGGKPMGDQEGMADWFYYYVPDGTMIVGPGRVRIWIPADRQTCPQVIAGDMTDGMCPSWMDVPQ
jgi:hypothetical protein